MNKKLIIGLIVVAVLWVAAFVWYGQQQSQLGAGYQGFNAFACDTNTVTAAGVGADESSTILAAHSRRAFAQIQLEENSAGIATSTVYISFDEGAAATLNDGLKLGTSTPVLTFGLNTDNPYVGAVTGITDTASTTVLVTECRY